MRAKQENKVIKQNNSSSQYRIYQSKITAVMKTRYKIAIVALVALAGSALLGGGFWWWFIGLTVGRDIIQFLLTLAMVLYVVFYALIIDGIFWILIS